MRIIFVALTLACMASVCMAQENFVSGNGSIFFSGQTVTQGKGNYEIF